MRKIFPELMVFVVVCSALSAVAQTQDRIDFLRDIKPIFSNHCYSCHGSEKQTRGLRLDEKQAVLKGGMSGPVLKPGKGQDSLLYRKVAGAGPGARMPFEGEKLSAAQTELIRVWIDQGALWPSSPEALPRLFGATREIDQGGGYYSNIGGIEVTQVKHWAYVKPVRPKLPVVNHSTWGYNPIDHFVLAGLEDKGLKASPEASRETLIRRVTLDLTGKPPTVEETDAFLNDEDPLAYEKLVDRLLKSPHYGERWARPWLDLARYADTHGYEKDRRRGIWPYRDWVIRALNDDMPFDRFTVEQIAGDLLPDATLDQQVATGFNRNTLVNEEGGTDPEEYRLAAILDRVNTTAAVWLGSTFACAQCHEHKYDPFKQEEYYRFFAFFNQTEEEVEVFRRTERRSRGPIITLPSPSHLASHRLDTERQIYLLESLLAEENPELVAAQSQWENEIQDTLVTWNVLEPTLLASTGGASLIRMKDNSILVTGKNRDKDTFVVEAEVPWQGMVGIRLEALNHSSLPQSGSGRSDGGNFILTGVEVEISPLEEGEDAIRKRVVFNSATAEYSQSGFGIQGVLDDSSNTGWSISVLNSQRKGYYGGGKEEGQVDRQAILVAEEPIGFEGGTRLTIRLRHDHEKAQHVLGHFRLAVSSAENPSRHVEIPTKLQKILSLAGDRRTEGQRRELSRYFRSIAPPLEPLRERMEELGVLWQNLNSPISLVMKRLPQPRKTYVHVKGNFLDKGKLVKPGVPAVLHPLKSKNPDRLDLAYWLVDEENPLVGRVTLNRLWMEHFGRGLVETPEDFGSQGDLPTHPELLDWLATEFVRQRWSMKAMHRLMVTSATYRQSSQVTPYMLERDPYNRLLARGPRFRMDAEMIRDNALSVAGLLSSRMYGPSVFPTQPEGIWNLVNNQDKWVESSGEDRYRRGIYTFWRRTAPYPAFLTFDAPSRETSCLSRTNTNTPLQSLTTLNDPIFFDAARGLAKRMMLEEMRTEASKITFGHRLVLSRYPQAKELERLMGLFQEELGNFRKNRKAASHLALGGKVVPPEGADLAEFAAWTVVANVLLNLDETITRG